MQDANVTIHELEIGDYQVLCLFVISIMKAHRILFVKGPNRKIPTPIQLQSRICVFDNKHKCRSTLI